MWIGGHKEAGIWKWFGLRTGPITVSYWAANQPSGDGDCLDTWNSLWNDVPCTGGGNYFHFVCEKAIK